MMMGYIVWNEEEAQEKDEQIGSDNGINWGKDFSYNFFLYFFLHTAQSITENAIPFFRDEEFVHTIHCRGSGEIGEGGGGE